MIIGSGPSCGLPLTADAPKALVHRRVACGRVATHNRPGRTVAVPHTPSTRSEPAIPPRRPPHQPPTGLAAPAVALGKPRLRGVVHQYALVAAVVAGTVLVLRAPTATASTAAAVYAASVCGLFGVSALYHRRTWTASVRRRLRQLDHAMIFLLIAGTYTPVGLLVLKGPLAVVVLGVVWSGAAVGVALQLGWRHAPGWVGVAVYVALGWVAVVALPQLVQHLGVAGTVLLLGGGLAYTAGAVVYARRRALRRGHPGRRGSLKQPYAPCAGDRKRLPSSFGVFAEVGDLLLHGTQG